MTAVNAETLILCIYGSFFICFAEIYTQKDLNFYAESDRIYKGILKK